MENKFKFSDIRVRFDDIKKEFYVTINNGRDELTKISTETFVRDGSELQYKFYCSSAGAEYDYLYIKDIYRWIVVSKHSVVERLLGYEIPDSKEFSIEELKELENGINEAYENSFSSVCVFEEDGVKKASMIKKGDVVFASESDDETQFMEINEKYHMVYSKRDRTVSIVTNSPYSKVVIPVEKLPLMEEVSFKSRKDKKYGVFKAYDYYLDCAEFGRFTAAAYKNFAEIKRKKDEGEPQGPNS